MVEGAAAGTETVMLEVKVCVSAKGSVTVRDVGSIAICTAAGMAASAWLDWLAVIQESCGITRKSNPGTSVDETLSVCDSDFGPVETAVKLNEEGPTWKVGGAASTARIRLFPVSAM